MKYIEDRLLDFRAYAKEQLESHVAELNNIDNNMLMSGKLARIKIFNAHLQSLQKQLDERKALLLQQPQVSALNISEELERALAIASNDYINEYMCIRFFKNDT
ncbi:MAG: hypothetical protein JWQ38_3593 [Flavipsychrobacter sp.]|nr:hypothetical protein [Flavipsychrobacter sp.]